jgi:predicted DNA-binding transcriptional regulator AlpA
MLATTLKIVRSGLEADPTLTPRDRARLVTLLRNNQVSADRESATESVARIIRRREAAARLGCSVRTVDKLHTQGILQKRRLPGRQRSSGFLESDVVALITQKEAA